MEWKDFIINVNRDETDNNALERYNEWTAAVNDDSITPIDMISRGLDPDILNEFCFYPIHKWDRLIRWAMYFSNEEVDMKEKMYRATLLNYRIDPDGIDDVDQETLEKRDHDLEQGIDSDEVRQMPITSWWLGSSVQYAYNTAIKEWGDDSLTMEEVSFKFNSIIDAIVIRNDKDIQKNMPIRKMAFFQKDMGDALSDDYKKSRIFEILGLDK